MACRRFQQPADSWAGVYDSLLRNKTELGSPGPFSDGQPIRGGRAVERRRAANRSENQQRFLAGDIHSDPGAMDGDSRRRQWAQSGTELLSRKAAACRASQLGRLSEIAA